MSTSFQLGKYRIIAELGQGGMANVFLAIVEGPLGSGFAKLSVVKRLRSNLADDPEFVAMLVDEARITARLNHPNVVQMLEVGVESDEYFLAMEYLDGQPLHRIERRAARVGRDLTRDMHIAVLCDTLAGLHHAHELNDYDGKPLNVVHRDVNPQNLFVTYDGQVKVVDFGIAKAAGRACETRHGIVKGKVRYMSPEQAMGQPVDRKADIFAVGVLVWQVATGKKLWGELDELAIVQALIAGDYPASPASVVPDVPESIDRICRKALAANPDERYATADEMRVDLEAVLGDRSMSTRRELGRLTAELFDKERGQLRAVVEQATRAANVVPSIPKLMSRVSTRPSASPTSLAAITVGGSGDSPPPPSAAMPAVISQPAVPVARPADAVVSASIQNSLPPAVLQVPSSSRRRHWYVGGIAAALGACVAATSVLALPTETRGAVRSPASRVADMQPLESNATSLRVVVPGPVVVTPGVAVAVAAPRSEETASRIVKAPPPVEENTAPTTAAPTPSASSPTGLHGAPPKHTRGRLSIDATDPWSNRGK